MGKIDEAGDAVRKIAGYLPYNPGPGIYSRLERAIEQMPENVRVQELPGLLKRYKDGVPGWELKETDLDSVIGGRPVVSRDELLAQVRERSPVYTHKEIVLGGNPPRRPAAPDGSEGDYDVPISVRQASPSSLGEGVHHGLPRYADYGHGGKDYTEILITQPGADGTSFSSHWQNGAKGIRESVAHARFDTHGDALRINELQSDLGIHNRKMRESGGKGTAPTQLATETDEDYVERLSAAGWRGEWGEDGEMVIRGQTAKPFPLEDDWLDLLIKRLALEAARGGHRAIEIASPRAIADKVGGNIENYEHVYNKVAPGRLERLGRKMGGLTDVTPPRMDGAREIGERLMGENARALRDMDEAIGYETGPGDYGVGLPVVADIGRGMSALDEMAYRPAPGTGNPGSRIRFAADLPANIEELARMVGPENMNEWMLRAREAVAAQRRAEQATFRAAAIEDKMRQPSPPRRYIMSDEMRRRIIEGGIGAAVAAPVLSDDELIQRLNQ